MKKVFLNKLRTQNSVIKKYTSNVVSNFRGALQSKETPETWLGRTGTGDEAANAIVFLSADESGCITGTDLPVDGGRTLGPITTAFKAN